MPKSHFQQKYYLKEFEKFDTSDFCLAHVFTYRDFPKGIQGLAWKNTTCRENWNTGFTTVLNHQVSLRLKFEYYIHTHIYIYNQLCLDIDAILN